MKVHIDTGRSYDIIIERGALALLGRTVKELGAEKAALVADDRVFWHYGDRALELLENEGIPASAFTFPHGEGSKTLDNFSKIINFFAENHLTRGDVAIALGGGVTGDTTGFAAACYLRGIRYVQVPTTLLAMVDSSVGGKTAVDLDSGKNLCGAFWQPAAVLCDPDLLKTLDEAVFNDGCGEVVKYAMLGCRELENIILRGGIRDEIEEVIRLSVEMKRDIIADDERDMGRRRLLNFGHTAGHAIELLNGYKLSHGRCVAEGMEIITRAAVKKGICPEERLAELDEMLELCKLEGKCRNSAGEIFRAACGDKKVLNSSITLIVPNESGCYLTDIPLEELRKWIFWGL